MADGTPSPGGGWVPTPQDPTALTATAVNAARDDLRREIAALRELLEAQIAAVRDELRQTWKLHDADIERERAALNALREVVFEKFSERDLRFDQLNVSRQLALDMALRTARELVDTKAEAAQAAADKFQEAIVRQLADQVRSNAEARTADAALIRALEQRMDRVEGTGAGVAAQRAEQRLSTGQLIAIAGVILVAAGVIVSVFAIIHG